MSPIPISPSPQATTAAGARAALREIAARNKLPIVTGGTGLYLRALTDGLFAGPARQENLRQRLRRSLQRHESAWLHRLLTRLDPASAARIHANDTPKLIRAIEVCLAARQPMSQMLARDPLTGFRLLRIGLNPPARGSLYDRLNHRCAGMFRCRADPGNTRSAGVLRTHQGARLPTATVRHSPYFSRA